jgi:hypothetical protein
MPNPTRADTLDVTVIAPTQPGDKQIVRLGFSYSIAVNEPVFDDSVAWTIVEDALRLADKMDGAKYRHSQAHLLAVICSTFIRVHADLDYEISPPQ